MEVSIKAERLQLDTTIQISRLFSESGLKEFLRELIELNECYVSKYVLCEFKRTLVKSFVAFHTILEEEQDLSDALIRASQFGFAPRQLVRLLYVIDELSKQPGITQTNVKPMLIRLERLYREELFSRFEEGVRYINDEVGCKPSDATLDDKSLFMEQIKCQKARSKCRLDRFVAFAGKKISLARYIELSTIAPYNTPEVAKVASVCQKVLSDPREAKGNNCRVLGDLIIAMETPKNHTVVSTNVKDFEIACKASDKKFFPVARPPSSS